MNQDEAKALVAKHGSQRKAATAVGMSRSTLQHILDGRSTEVKVRPFAGTKPYVSLSSTVAVRSVADFRNTYDLNTIVPKKVAEGFKQLGSGWLYEAEFAKSAGLTMKDLGMFRDNYAAHVVVVGDSRRIWVGKKTIAEQMRSMV